ncbi:MAG: hypothetical protein HFG27_07630 [Provencibacterium sp.]|nr:hypothetical protein [Provencibacterium sp.]
MLIPMKNPLLLVKSTYSKKSIKRFHGKPALNRRTGKCAAAFPFEYMAGARVLCMPQCGPPDEKHADSMGKAPTKKKEQPAKIRLFYIYVAKGAVKTPVPVF